MSDKPLGRKSASRPEAPAPAPAPVPVKAAPVPVAVAPMPVSVPVSMPVKDSSNGVVAKAAPASVETTTTVTQNGPDMMLVAAGPEPAKFAVGPGQTFAVMTSTYNMALRAGTGGFCSGYKITVEEFGPSDNVYCAMGMRGRRVIESSIVATFPRPKKVLELYEYESCPFCKKVREAFIVLDLDVIVYPCPKEGPTWRPKAIALGGKQQFPMLVDANADKIMYESDEIIAYLFKTYGNNKIPLTLRLGSLTTLSCIAALAPRFGAGGRYTGSKLPSKPLTFWSYEGSPFCKLVREVLSELEISYLQISCGRGSPKRQVLLEKRDSFQAPYLEDPNSGIFMFESGAIVSYLRSTYGCKA